jgi:hypothetical protein
MEKLLITPLITPGGIPSEEQLRDGGIDSYIVIPAGE